LVTDLRGNLEIDGFTLRPGVYDACECLGIVTALEEALSAEREGPLRRGSSIYGARNVAALWPEAEDVWRTPALIDLLRQTLGDQFGLVRVLYFDKPPDASWSLPWHKDLTIAVQDNRLPSSRFVHPTTKAGVPHIEAPQEILKEMLTLRLHLDSATTENGPLQVIPGSQRDRPETSASAKSTTIFANAGDVLAMRPLLSHCSGLSQPGSRRHRRILHFEFAASPRLPDGFSWWRFVVGLSASAERM
jgi:hypothetical protein